MPSKTGKLPSKVQIAVQTSWVNCKYAVHLKLERAQVLGRNDGVRDSQEGQQAWSDIQVQLPGGLKQIHVHVGLTYYDV